MKFGVITVSDRASKGVYDDETGPAVSDAASRAWANSTPLFVEVIPDDRRAITERLIDKSHVVDVILTNGGTGLGPRDVTPEATRDAIDREVPGLGELMRRRGAHDTPMAALSRQACGMIGGCLVVNLPGSTRAALQSLSAVAELIPHAVAVASGDGHR